MLQVTRMICIVYINNATRISMVNSSCKYGSLITTSKNGYTAYTHTRRLMCTRFEILRRNYDINNKYPEVLLLLEVLVVQLVQVVLEHQVPQFHLGVLTVLGILGAQKVLVVLALLYLQQDQVIPTIINLCYRSKSNLY